MSFPIVPVDNAPIHHLPRVVGQTPAPASTPAFVAPLILGIITGVTTPSLINQILGNTLMVEPIPYALQGAEIAGGAWVANSQNVTPEIATFGSGMMWGAGAALLISLVTDIVISYYGI